MYFISNFMKIILNYRVKIEFKVLRSREKIGSSDSLRLYTVESMIM